MVSILFTIVEHGGFVESEPFIVLFVRKSNCRTTGRSREDGAISLNTFVGYYSFLLRGDDTGAGNMINNPHMPINMTCKSILRLLLEKKRHGYFIIFLQK